MYPMLLVLLRFQEATQKLEKHILSNGPHLVSLLLAEEVTENHILRGISKNFRTINMEDPVYANYEADTFA